MQDIKANIEIACGKEWPETYAEDASWNTLKWQIENISRAIAGLKL